MSSINKTQRRHKATYARDKKNGGYLIRVKGPEASAFAGREVPVEVMGKGEHTEKLTKLIWAGTDDGKLDGQAGPCALYAFEAKPRVKEEAVF